MSLFPLPTQHFILTVSCADQTGIVAAVSGFLASRDSNILDSSQYSDPESDRFFIRVHFETPGDGADRADLMTGFAETAEKFGMDWDIHDANNKPNVLVMVSREGHCLNDLLYRYRIGTLPVNIPAIVSNHRDFYQLAAWHDIPFHHVPVTKDSKQSAEDKLIEILETEQVDLVVLARYMQILSPKLCELLSGRCINIHHSFLPSFKGARPYHQAWKRGVKLIGATAHYVTEDLDEGPIIEQEVERVDHRLTPDQLAAVGQDIESRVLARAVRWHAEHRVFINGSKTVVFR
ncbi:MAG: formyltetrahydrofolate deformylase [Alphaproteobacteria bacterium]